MKAQGKYVRNVLCEHFNHSRQELFDLVKIHDLRSYDDVLDKLGMVMVARCASLQFHPFWQVYGTK
jgi:NAD(P)H-nitrite reductase large subunit